MAAFYCMLLLLSGSVSSQDDGAERSWLETRGMIGLIPVEVEEGALTSKNPEITVEIPGYKKKEFGELSARIKGALVRDGQLRYTGLQYPETTGKPRKRHKSPSFFVDYNEPAFAPLAKEIKTRFGPKPTMAELTEYVAGFITKKTLRRSYDLASKVATTREGDCTEHAVLLAALARKYNYPSSIINGIVILETDGRYFAMGHAWIEYWQKGKWQMADAALRLLGDEKKAVSVHAYLPLSVHENEGPGIGSTLISGGSAILHVKRLIIKQGPR